MKLKLFLIEDDPVLLAQMKEHLIVNYEVYTASTLAKARELLAKVTPDAAVLDLILPDGNGMDLLKANELSCPTIILTTIADDEEHIDGLNSGAKDYLIKPVSLRILERHIEARTATQAQSLLVSGRLVIDTRRRTVFYGDTQVMLTSTEFNILVYLFRHANEFHTAQNIYLAVYGNAFLQSTTIKRHLSKLRYKLAQSAPDKTYIQTSYGNGYRFIKEPER